MSDEPSDQCKVVLEELFQATAWLHHYWHFYLALYGSAPERFDTFNERTPHIFGLFERTLRHTVLLELAKLLGSHKSVGNNVVSIRRAIVDLPISDNDPRKRAHRKRLEEIQQKHDAIRAMRDSAIAHTDLAVVTNAKQLDGISRAAIRDAINDCVKITNEVLRVHNKSEYGFMDHGTEEREVQVLLKILKLGNAELDRLHVERQKRWQTMYNTSVELPDDPLEDDVV